MDTDTHEIDLIWGISAIARAIGRTNRQTYHLLANGEFPAKRVGGRWVADRDVLVAFFKRKGGRQ